MTLENPPDYLERILNAQVYDVAIETPLELATNLSTRIGNSLFLKREDLQPVRSFKLRGAYNKMSRLDVSAKARGVICASAGNHAQGVALAAERLGIHAVIVMPVTTPRIKIDAVLRRGGEVVLAGESYSDAYEHAVRLGNEQALTFVHPYDDEDVIAGQGTIAMEILRQPLRPIDAIFCAVGGGGLIAGVAAYVKRLRPETRVIGVETVDADAMTRSLQRGERVCLDQVGLFADGTAVKQVGREPFRLCQSFVDDMVLVDNDAICAAIKDVFEDTRSILEPAGALSVAGAKLYARREAWKGKTIVCITSGANMNFDRLRFVAERAELGEQREAILAVTIPERPGSFRRFCQLLGERNVTEFNYRYADSALAHVFVGLTIQNRREVDGVVAELDRQGLPTLDLTDDEMAKTHVRYMVGGRAPAVEHERLVRLVFPERPGALMKFLTHLHSEWNISLFHYRNHGSDFGRVLVGMQVPPHEDVEFRAFLDGLGYEYADESDNPAYRLFLG
jgi:threonine dehydratase